MTGMEVLGSKRPSGARDQRQAVAEGEEHRRARARCKPQLARLAHRAGGNDNLGGTAERALGPSGDRDDWDPAGADMGEEPGDLFGLARLR